MGLSLLQSLDDVERRLVNYLNLNLPRDFRSAILRRLT